MAWSRLLLLIVLLLSAIQPVRAANQLCFSQTGQCIEGRFWEYWEQNGGLPVFGYPITASANELNRDTGQSYVTQWFERARFELHSENARPYDVLLGLLGTERLTQLGRDWQAEPQAPTNAAHRFSETGHAIAPEFWDYWSSHGLDLSDRGTSARESLALFGYPVTEPRIETNSSGETVLTQWFERARFEHHPDNPSPYRVQLGLLGREVLTNSSGHKVVVFLQGVCSSLPDGDAHDTSDNIFHDLEQVLKRDYGYHDEDFLLYSYLGGLVNQQGDWVHVAYDKNVPVKQDLQASWHALHDQLLQRYHDHHPDTRFVLVGHSLGGLIAFEEVLNGVRSATYQLGTIDSVITVDSPLLGVTSLVGLAGKNFAASCFAGGGLGAAVPDQVAALHTTAYRDEVTQAVQDASKKGVSVHTTGNTNDCVWEPTNCNIPVSGDILTQWIAGASTPADVFYLPCNHTDWPCQLSPRPLKPCLDASADCIGDTHTAALHDGPDNRYGAGSRQALARIAQLVGARQ